MSLLQGRTVVVSGVGAGLGHQVAAAVVRDGGNAVLGARTEANLAESAAELDPDGAHTAFRATDITDEGSARPSRHWRSTGSGRSTRWCTSRPGTATSAAFRKRISPPGTRSST